ncbi:MAG: PIN domain-containing protein [Methanoregula sp.]|nr:PIN domain-containing protein [Methanoregula sp.]
MPFEEFKPEYSRALHFMEPVDADDTSFLAVGLALHQDGIWTENQHFPRQDLMKVFHTSDLIQLI